MKRFLAVLVAFAVAALPVAASALVPASAPLVYDDGTYEPPSFLLNTTTGPVVQFDNPTPGVAIYALDSVSLYLEAATAGFYPLTVQIWDDALTAVETIPVTIEVLAAGGALHPVDLSDKDLAFASSIRVGVFLREDPLFPPLGDIFLGVDTSAAAAGQSYLYNTAPVLPETTWTGPDTAADYGIQSSGQLVPMTTCQGFLPPLNRTIKMKRGGRTIPLKAFLFDAAGAPVTDELLTAPPTVQLLWAPDDVAVPVDVTPFVAAPGRSNMGQAFRNRWGGKWQYNLKTKKDLPAGYYTVRIVGDGAEYVVDPTCTGYFVVSEGPKLKKAPKGRKK